MRLVFASILLAAAPARAAWTPACDTLPAAKRAVVAKVFSAVHPYEGCTETLEKCLAAKPRTRLSARLADDVCRLVAAGKEAPAVQEAMARRARSMKADAPKFDIAADEAMSAGDAAAPVKAVVYACARCPFCSVMVPALHREVTQGALKGKVRLYYRPYPLKSHPGATEGALAFAAAAKLGRFWPFVLHEYAHMEQFDPDELPAWAAAVGMDRSAFERAMADAKTREAVVESRKEGLRNKVEATPTVFVDGRRYDYELETPVLVDVLQEEWERATGAR